MINVDDKQTHLCYSTANNIFAFLAGNLKMIVIYNPKTTSDIPSGLNGSTVLGFVNRSNTP